MDVHVCVCVCTCLRITMCYAATHSGLSSRQSTEAGLKFASSTAVQQQVQIRTPAPTDVPASLLAVFALTPDPAVGANAFAPQSRQWRLMRLCSQMLVPSQSVQMLLLRRLCSQMPAHPQFLHLLLWRGTLGKVCPCGIVRLVYALLTT